MAAIHGLRTTDSRVTKEAKRIAQSDKFREYKIGGWDLGASLLLAL